MSETIRETLDPSIIVRQRLIWKRVLIDNMRKPGTVIDVETNRNYALQVEFVDGRSREIYNDTKIQILADVE